MSGKEPFNFFEWSSSKQSTMIMRRRTIMLLTNRHCGLVDVIHPPDRLHKEDQVYADFLVKKPTQALAAIRRTITGGRALSFEEGMEIEYESTVDLAGTSNFT